MSKAFTKESDDADDEELPAEQRLPQGSRNYMTPAGYRRMFEELTHLVKTERPEVVGVVSWAASNGDRSENGDYIYGKRRLREIDRRIRYLTKRLDNVEVVDPEQRQNEERIFFGATVTFANSQGEERTISIVGLDELDPKRGYVSWISPIARALTKAQAGDTVKLQTPAGMEELEIIEVVYQRLD